MLASERTPGFGKTLRGALIVAGLALASLLAAEPAMADAVIGDRLVVVVNNVPYSQRQVEVYIQIKESLRKTTDGATRTIGAGNWLEALAVFTEDMIVLQESQRLGSFQAPEQAFDKYLAIVRDKIEKGPAFAAALKRLGVTETGLSRTLEEVLRIAAFWRSKERQDQQNGQPGKSDQWLAELVGRASVRRSGDAGSYVMIEPARGSGDGGP